MNLGELLLALKARALVIDVRSDGVFCRGKGGKADLLPHIREHKAHLTRLFRPRQASWRAKLLRADPDTQEIWALLAHGYEQAGDPAAVAEFLAWHDVREAFPVPVSRFQGATEFHVPGSTFQGVQPGTRNSELGTASHSEPGTRNSEQVFP